MYIQESKEIALSSTLRRLEACLYASKRTLCEESLEMQRDG